MLPLSGERIAHAGQLGLYGSIEHLVPDGHAHAADQRLVDGDDGLELQAEFLLEGNDQFLTWASLSSNALVISACAVPS